MGTLQSYLQDLVPPDGCLLQILSIDIIFGHQADLMNATWRSKWLFAFRSKYILAFFAGPPCETFSGARHHVVDQLKVRPVRSHQEPWGLSCLAIREAIQVNTSNILLWFVLLCVQQPLRDD